MFAGGILILLSHIGPLVFMSVIKSNMATIAVYYTKFWWMVPQNFMIAIHGFVFNKHTFKIFQKLNHRNIFEIIEIQFTTGVSLSKAIFPCKYIYIYIYIFMSSQGNVKSHVFKKQAWIPLIFMFHFYFIS